MTSHEKLDTPVLDPSVQELVNRALLQLQFTSIVPMSPTEDIHVRSHRYNSPLATQELQPIIDRQIIIQEITRTQEMKRVPSKTENED